MDGPVDIVAIDAALGERPATHEKLLELASRVELDTIADALRTNQARDLRWRMALRHALVAGGKSGRIPQSSATLLGSLEHTAQLVALADGYLGLCYERGAQNGTLVRLDRSFSILASRPLLDMKGKMAVLPSALRGSAEPMVVLYTPGTSERSCFLFDDTLRVVRRADARLPESRSEVRYALRIGDELMIEGNQGLFWAPLRDAPDQLEFPHDESRFEPPRRFLSESYFGFHRRARPVWVDGWLTTAGAPELVKGTGWVSRELHWIHLDRDVVHTTISWPSSATGWAVHEGALWIASDEGLHRSAPGEDVQLVHPKARSFYGMASGSDGLILSTRSREWVTTDRDGRPRGRGALAEEISPFATHALADGLLVGSQSWSWIGSEGVRAGSCEGGALVVPDDRHVVSGFVAGRSGYVARGRSLVRVDFPGDAVAEASFGELLLARVGTTRYAFGREGLCKLEQEDLSPPKRTHYGGGWRVTVGSRKRIASSWCAPVVQKSGSGARARLATRGLLPHLHDASSMRSVKGTRRETHVTIGPSPVCRSTARSYMQCVVAMVAIGEPREKPRPSSRVGERS